jgi:hypothetical protein
MKSLICALVFLFCSSAMAQNVVATNVWVPVYSNNVAYIQTVIPTVTYNVYSIPVNVPTVQYYQVPFVYYGPSYQPVVQIVRPCLFCPGRFYYINSPVKY